VLQFAKIILNDTY